MDCERKLRESEELIEYDSSMSVFTAPAEWPLRSAAAAPSPPAPAIDVPRGGRSRRHDRRSESAAQYAQKKIQKVRTGPRAGGPSSHGVAQRPSAEAQGRQGRRCGLSFRILVKTGSPHTTRPMYIFMRMASAEIKCITRASSAAAWVAA